MKRPKVIINLAMSADGKIAMPDGRQLEISSKEDFARVNGLRNRCDAILVGIGTILNDDPSLLVKKRFVKRPRQPLRVVLDSKGRTPARAKVLDPRARTLVAVTKGHVRGMERKVKARNVQVRAFGTSKVSLKGLLGHLARSGIKKVMVEGGGDIIWSFIRAGLVDEMTIFVGNMVIGGKGPTPAMGKGARNLRAVISLELRSVRRMQGGVLLRYRPERGK